MNKDLFIKGMIFLAGGAIGSLVTWKLVKTKYEQIADEEIESMREHYADKKAEEIAESKDKESGEIDLLAIRNKLQELGELNEKVMAEKKEKEEKNMNGPVIVPPEETWERDYPTLSLTYYEGDKVLANDKDKIVDNIEELVGRDFADHFGEYEQDSVFVRNDNVGVYYEILRDYGSYMEHMEID